MALGSIDSLIRWTPRTQQTRMRGFINAFRFSLPRRPLLPSSIARGCVLARCCCCCCCCCSLSRSLACCCCFVPSLSFASSLVGPSPLSQSDNLLSGEGAIFFFSSFFFSPLHNTQDQPARASRPHTPVASLVVCLSVCLSVCRLCSALVSKPANQSTRRRPLRFAGAGSAASRHCAAPTLLLVLAYTITLMMITLMMIDTTARPSSRGERHGTHRYTIYPCHTTHADKTISLASYIITHPT